MKSISQGQYPVQHEVFDAEGIMRNLGAIWNAVQNSPKSLHSSIEISS